MNQNWKPVTIVILIAIVFCLALPSLIAVINRRDQVAGFNQEIQYDDFAFSVQAVRKTKTLGTQAAQGIYYIVTLKVANHARRVDFQFDNLSAMLADDEGRKFYLSPDGQKALAAARGGSDPCAAALPAGASCVTEIVFDLPADASNPHLRISKGEAVGDILDIIFYGKKIIKLES